MKDISIRELSDLAIARVAEPESRIQRMFEWHFDREMTLAKALLGAAASIVIAVALALFKNEIHVAWWWILAVAVSAVTLFVVGLARYWMLKKIHRQFVDALKLHRELQEISPFVQLYRQRRRQ